MRFPEFTEEWKITKIGDITSKVGSGVTPKGGSAVYKTSGHLFIRSQNVGNGCFLLDDVAYIDEATHKKQINTELKDGDVLLNITGASIGRTTVVNKNVEGGNVNQHVCIIRLLEDYSPNYICNYLLSYGGQKQIDSFQAGGNREGLNFEQIRSIKFFIPSFREQSKIASLLSLLEERIATQNKIIEDLKKLKVAICNKLIDNLVNREPLIRFTEVYSKAGEGGTPETSKSEYYENGNIPFIKIDDLSNKYIISNKDFITELGLQKSSAWIIPTHSLIYSNGATIGAISINTYEVCTKQGILGIVPKTSISVEYLYCLMLSNYFSKRVHRIITHGTMATAYLKDINKIKVPIPCMQKQLEIANTFSSVTNKIETELNILSLLLKQKQYLLQQMFI